MWRLDAMNLKCRALCCLIHDSVKAFINSSGMVLLLLCSPYDCIPVIFELKSAFFI